MDDDLTSRFICVSAAVRLSNALDQLSKGEENRRLGNWDESIAASIETATLNLGKMEACLGVRPGEREREDVRTLKNKIQEISRHALKGEYKEMGESASGAKSALLTQLL